MQSLDLLMGNGKILTLENCGDVLRIQLFDEDGELEHEKNWDIDSVAEMLLELL